MDGLLLVDGLLVWRGTGRDEEDRLEGNDLWREVLRAAALKTDGLDAPTADTRYIRLPSDDRGVSAS